MKSSKSYSLPDNKGYYGKYGGIFVPEILIPAIKELENAYFTVKKDKNFQRELDYYLKTYAGRPTPLYFAKRLSDYFGKNIKIYLKREDLLHTGAHKINNTIGQVLLAKKLGKKRIIAETGAGQHGVATATASALMGLKCIVYMGEKDVKRQSLNVLKMKLLGAEVVPVKTGSQTLKDAINEALRDWATNVKTTYYVLGSVVGPHPYPLMVRDFQTVIGNETKEQILKIQNKLPDMLIACVGGGSNSIGFFYPFISENVRLIGVEAGGENNKKNAATLNYGSPGILHGSLTFVLQNKDGQISETHSIAPGLDYPGVGPEHSYLKSIKRVEYKKINDKLALDSFALLSKTEGIIPALEPSHALGYILENHKSLKNKTIIVCLSGRGDKDIGIIEEYGI